MLKFLFEIYLSLKRKNKKLDKVQNCGFTNKASGDELYQCKDLAWIMGKKKEDNLFKEKETPAFPQTCLLKKRGEKSPSIF